MPPPDRPARHRGAYVSLFLFFGVWSLAITYLLADHAITGNFTYTYTGPNGATGVASCRPGTRPGSGQAGRSAFRQCRITAIQAHATVMHHLLVYSGIALAIMARAAVRSAG